MREIGVHEFASYASLLDSDNNEKNELLECLVTHTTGFFREPAHFDWLRSTGLEMLQSKSDEPIRVWSAACSTGAELWSAAMEIAAFQANQGKNYQAELFGTDISRTILLRAVDGVYEFSEIEAIPDSYRAKFIQKSSGTLDRFRICPQILNSAKFEQLNLVESSNSLGKFDLIFLRNILIYFDKYNQERALEYAVSHLSSGGILMIGHTEAQALNTSGLKRLAPAIFMKE
ncbi:CheR family methyltransferase [Falsihalocynthiibacter sp. SS001]|uniref:CheR family methyltransferase n=1 Tax=Falsihalocynthiibacter sp. SS001 TaxID=3349698 RepID=UPI0036D3D8C8